MKLLNGRWSAISIVFLLGCCLCLGCGSVELRTMEATAYCGCGECNGYTRGSWPLLKLDFWNRYVSYGPRKGEKYTGMAAAGTRKLKTPRPGLFSEDSLYSPWRIPHRVLLFPIYGLPRDGTIAADTRFHPFGTRIYVPGWGWGVVEDVGGAIKGPTRLDLYHPSHRAALRWGRQQVEVMIERP